MPAPKFWKSVPAQTVAGHEVVIPVTGGTGTTRTFKLFVLVQPLAVSVNVYTTVTAPDSELFNVSLIAPVPDAVTGDTPVTPTRVHE